jgi:hypothetical protein
VIEGEQPIHPQQLQVGQAKIVATVQRYRLDALGELVAQITDGAARERKGDVVPRRRSRREQRPQGLQRIADGGDASRPQPAADAAAALDLDARVPGPQQRVGIGAREREAAEASVGERALQQPGIGIVAQPLEGGEQVVPPRKLTTGEGGASREVEHRSGSPEARERTSDRTRGPRACDERALRERARAAGELGMSPWTAVAPRLPVAEAPRI